MPKVTPKAKVSSKAAVETESKTAVKEKETAARLKLIEGLAEEYGETIAAFREADEASKNKFFDMADELTALVNANGLTEKEARQLSILAMATAYEVEADSITMEGQPTIYANVSKVLRLVFPKTPAAAKALAKARAKGVTVNNALEIARGKMLSAPVSKGKGKDASGAKATKNGKEVLDDPEVLQNEFSAIIARAIKGEFSLEDIQESFATVIAEYEEADTEAED